jgi:hypothetical protein
MVLSDARLGDCWGSARREKRARVGLVRAEMGSVPYEAPCPRSEVVSLIVPSPYPMPATFSLEPMLSNLCLLHVVRPGPEAALVGGESTSSTPSPGRSRRNRETTERLRLSEADADVDMVDSVELESLSAYTCEGE